jgi:hypothetical protein
VNPPRPYPFAALLAWLDCEDYGQVGELMGLPRTQIQGWCSRRRHFTEIEAERWASYFHAHPAEIWAELWWDLAPELV